MQCPACSTDNPAGAAFCQKCGTALGTAPPASGYTPVSGYTAPPAGAIPNSPGSAYPGTGMPPTGAPYMAGAGLSDNAAGAIAYLTFIPAVIFLVIAPYNRNPFVRFHAFQCIGLTIASVLLHVLIGFMIFVLHGFTFLLSSLVSVLFFVLWLICIVNAAQGKWFKVPVLGDFAEQQARR
jgi:uncharacterized membrane protein